MMTEFNKDILKKLIGEYWGPCVSIFMPTHRRGAENEQDQIRFKNLLREAGQNLIEIGFRSQHVKNFLEPAQKLLKDSSFWQNQIDGLVIFLCPDTFFYYRLPIHFKELVVVTDRFHIKPILPLFGGGRFYVLALSQNQVRLFKGSRYSVAEIDLEGAPKSLSEALKHNNSEKQLHFHTGAPGSIGERGAIFHGHGVGTDDAKDNILQYFRQIDRRLREVLKDERSPLMLAGVEYLFPIYSEANTYPYLVKKGIVGNPERLSPEDLHEVAWTIVQPYFKKAEKDAVAKYKEFVGIGKTSSDVRKIVPTAYYGRVDLLFVAVGIQNWGTFDPDKNVVYMHKEPEPGDADLLDFAAFQTLLHGGSVYAVEPDIVPDDASLAAVFRY